MAEWWPSPEGIRVGPDGSWSVGEFRIVHLPSLRFLKARLVFEDEGAFLVEGDRRLPVAVEGPAFEVTELRLDAAAGEARVVLDDGSEEVVGPTPWGPTRARAAWSAWPAAGGRGRPSRAPPTRPCSSTSRRRAAASSCAWGRRRLSIRAGA